MKTLLLALVSLLLLPLHAQQEAGYAPVLRKRAYMGMVVDELQVPQPGLLVRAVAPGSPAAKAGLVKGDVVLRIDQTSLSSRRELRKLVAASAPGTVFRVELLRAGRSHVLLVVLEERPVGAGSRPTMAAPMSTDKSVLPIAVSEDIRKQIYLLHHQLRSRLASLPEEFDAAAVSRELQAIRNLARDANAGRAGWMSGRAGEISIRFKDERGSMVLHGADNIVTLEVYNHEGELTGSYVLNEVEVRRQLPADLLQRLHRLR